jgi:GT2 family glycosyltransferase
MNTSGRHQNNKIDIVIVTYKCYDDLERCIAAIYDDSASQEFIQDIIVVDNAPSHNYWNKAPELFDGVTIIKNDQNVGFACGSNLGMIKGSAPYILLLNPDTMIHPNMIADSLTFMERHPKVGIMGPKIVNEDGSIQGSARGFPDFSTLLFGRASPLNRIFPNNRWRRRNMPYFWVSDDEEDFYEVDWVSGAAAVIRRDAVEEIGYFDERFFMYWEDADLCQRMSVSGWDVVYHTGSQVTHLVAVCTEQNFVLNEARFHKSAFLLEQKQERNRWLGHLIIVAVALEFHFVFRLLWRAVEGRTRPRRVGTLPDRIKVLRIIARLNVGGPAIHVALLMHGLDPRVFESILVTGKVSSQEGDMSYLLDGSDKKAIMVSKLQRDLNLKNDLKALFRVLRILIQERPDVVHTHTAKAGAIGRIAVFVHNFVFGRKVRVIHTFHGHVFRGYFGKLKSLFFVWTERLLARITDVVVAVSEGQTRELSSQYHIAPKDKFRVVRLGFDLEPFFSAANLKGQFRKSLGIDSEMILVGIVGRLVPIKNHKMFLRSARIFLDNNPDVPARFLIIGDGELRNDLVAFCELQGLSDHVKFCGWKRDLPEVYADIDILCLTSINEGTPVSIIEAMASSVPVISTDAGGVRDLLGSPTRPSLRANPPAGQSESARSTNGQVPGISQDQFQVCERGILCQQDDAEALAGGLEYVIRNKHVWEDISNSARSFVANIYSKERLLRDLESVYLELLKRDRDKNSVKADAAWWGRPGAGAPFARRAP